MHIPFQGARDILQDGSSIRTENNCSKIEKVEVTVHVYSYHIGTKLEINSEVRNFTTLIKFIDIYSL
jgi:hypothetical protein